MFRFIFLMVIFFSLIVQPLWAQDSKPSVPTQVNKVNVFNKMTDYWAGLGENDIQRTATVKDRKERRRIKRLQSLERKKQQREQQREQKITKDMERLKGLR